MVLQMDSSVWKMQAALSPKTFVITYKLNQYKRGDDENP